MNIEAKLQRNTLLKPYTHFNIGGEAEFYIEPKSKEELKEAILWSQNNKISYQIFGGGSNLLVNDGLIEGLTIRLKNEDIKVMNERIRCGAGASLARLNSLALQNNLSGLEWSAGIPRATVGGAIRGCAEAFEISMGSLIETVEVFNIKKSEFEIFSQKMCDFSYRMSKFKKVQFYIIWEAILKLEHGGHDEISQKMEKSIEFRKIRYPKLPSAGSVFENVDPEYVKKASPQLYERELKDRIGREGKIGAGLLIDMAGLKGKSIGGAKISLEHANHIVNTGSATADDVAELISYIKQQIRDKFKLELKEEIVYFGF